MHPKRLNQTGVARRAFLGLGAASGAALSTGFWARLSTAAPLPQAPWLEATIPQLQSMMSSGQLTSRELTLGYLERINRLNPLLGAVIETNPNAVSIAAQLDNERRAGFLRGPLHGMPVLVKDNIATADNMQTTAGSLALRNSKVSADAPLVSRLRAAGALILGKANLSEWANFRGFAPFNGWSARGGFTRDPYVLDYDPCGSSSGSAAAPAANLCTAAVGTETDGSIVCPSGNNHVVGLKPTIGLVPQGGIIPIAHSQDTAGPIGRTVTDVAMMLGVMQNASYTGVLQRGALFGKRIGVDRRYFTPDYGGEPDIVAVVQTAMDVMHTLGATLIDTDTGDPWAFVDAEITVLLYEFKVQIAEYLATLGGTRLRTLADLILFNQEHCPQEMEYFGQEIFEWAESTSGNLTDPVYLAARQLCLQLTRTQGIDAALGRDNLDAIVAPSYSYASSPAAVAGYPNIAVPVGLRPDGKPAGIWMYSTAMREASLLAMAYDLEQALGPRPQPQLLGAPSPEPPDAGICASLPKANQGKPGLPHWPRRNLGTGKPLPGCLFCL